MRPIPIPEGVLEQVQTQIPEARVVTIGDPMRDMHAVEYVAMPSLNYQGRPYVQAVIELDDDDRAAIAAGGHIILGIDGGELPWSLHVALPDTNEVDRCPPL